MKLNGISVQAAVVLLDLKSSFLSHQTPAS